MCRRPPCRIVTDPLFPVTLIFGSKPVGRGGLKLDDEVEGALEAELPSLRRHEIAASRLAGADVGSIVDNPGQVTAWAASVAGSVWSTALTGMRLVVDCANGAASAVAPDVLRGLGATVEVIQIGRAHV